MSPDSLRQMLHLNKKFFSLFANQDVGYVDKNGYQYYGNIHNYGGEVYLESRKLLMQKPPIDTLHVSDTFSYYFDIRYAEDVNTINEQNMLICSLKKNVFLENHTYKIKFPDCKNELICRSVSRSDPNIVAEEAVVTESNPVLIIDGNEVELVFSDIGNTKFYFMRNELTEPFINDDIDEEPWESITDDVITIELTDKDCDLPFIWVYNDKLRTKDDASFEIYDPVYSRPVMLYGTDGHDQNYLLPLVYGQWPLQLNVETEWFVRVYPADTYEFTIPTDEHDIKKNLFVVCDELWLYTSSTDHTEFDQRITYNLHTSDYVSHYVLSDVNGYMGNDGKFYSTPLHTQPITPDNIHRYYDKGNDIYYVYDPKEKVFHELDETVEQATGVLSHYTGWKFDTDGDGKVYAYIKLDQFYLNYHGINTYNLGLFKTSVRPEYKYETEELSINAVSGIHVHSDSMYSDNGIIEHNGLIHNLYEFDGLPAYFQKFEDDKNRCFNRIELYAIRDKINGKNLHATDKPTAALILDSGYPINMEDMNSSYDSLESGIRYNYNLKRYDPYYVITDDVKNILTDIGYVDKYHLADVNIPRANKKYRLVYHGNRFFSCEVIQDFESKNYGRIYHVSNDPARYENNGSRGLPGSTLARICDIPTDFGQLTHVPNVAPTYVVDILYTRTQNNFSNTDNEDIWNKHIVSYVHDDTMIFDKYKNLNTIDLNQDKYYTWLNLNPYIELSETVYPITVADGGSGYEVGDEFTFMLGGQTIIGEVTAETGNVATIVSIPETYLVNISFLKPVQVFNTVARSGVGSGLKINITITDYADYAKTRDELNDELFLLKFDDRDNLWMYRYNTTDLVWYRDFQVFGTEGFDNPYWVTTDDSIENVYVKNLTQTTSFISNKDDVYEYTDGQIKIPYSTWSPFISTDIIPAETNLDTDLHVEMNDAVINSQNSYYYLFKEPFENYVRARLFELYPDEVANSLQLPKGHQLNMREYTNRTCAFSYVNGDNMQPNVCIFDSKSSYINGYEDYEANVVINHKETYTTKHIIDSLDNPTFKEAICDSSYVLRKNLYRIDETTPAFYNKMKSTYIDTHNREWLLDYIEESISKYADPVIVESFYIETLSDNRPRWRYSTEEIKTYALYNAHYRHGELTWPDISGTTPDPDNGRYDLGYPLTQLNEIELFQAVNTSAKTGTVQPKGDYVILDAETYDPTVHINGESTISLMDILHIFEIDIHPADMNNFRMYDANGNDISKNSLLIHGTDLFYFDEDQWVLKI